MATILQKLDDAISNSSLNDILEIIPDLPDQWFLEVDDFEQNYLHHACEIGNVDILKVLLPEVSKFIKPIEIKDQEGGTMAHYSSLTGHFELTQYLLQIDPQFEQTPNSSGLLPIHCASKENYSNLLPLFTKTINNQDNNGWTALHYAAANNRIECIKELINLGATKELKDNNNKTPKQICEEKEHLDALELLN